jgi:hypothetical protein
LLHVIGVDEQDRYGIRRSVYHWNAVHNVQVLANQVNIQIDNALDIVSLATHQLDCRATHRVPNQANPRGINKLVDISGAGSRGVGDDGVKYQIDIAHAEVHPFLVNLQLGLRVEPVVVFVRKFRRYDGSIRASLPSLPIEYRA